MIALKRTMCFVVGDGGLFSSVMYSQCLVEQCVTHSRQLRNIFVKWNEPFYKYRTPFQMEKIFAISFHKLFKGEIESNSLHVLQSQAMVRGNTMSG